MNITLKWTYRLFSVQNTLSRCQFDLRPACKTQSPGISMPSTNQNIFLTRLDHVWDVWDFVSSIATVELLWYTHYRGCFITKSCPPTSSMEVNPQYIHPSQNKCDQSFLGAWLRKLFQQTRFDSIEAWKYKSMRMTDQVLGLNSNETRLHQHLIHIRCS